MPEIDVQLTDADLELLGPKNPDDVEEIERKLAEAATLGITAMASEVMDVTEMDVKKIVEIYGLDQP